METAITVSWGNSLINAKGKPGAQENTNNSVIHALGN